MLLLVLAIIFGSRACFFIKYGLGPHSLDKSLLDADRGFGFPPGFPPDPGEAGKKTIEGIDADHDGIRDDVQRWIYALVPSDRDKQMALRQMARFYQEGLDLVGEAGSATKDLKLPAHREYLRWKLGRI